MSNVFHDDFYPTQRKTTLRMIEGLDLPGKTVFEPQAGTGAIIDVLKELNPKEIIACEINDDLRYTIQVKASTFLCGDFLDVTMEQVSHIDYIISNPPFSTSADHILHSFSVMPDGCELRCLVNHQTYKNNSNKKWKQIRRTVEMYGGTYVNLGPEFIDADRKTKIDIGLIAVKYPEGDSMGIDGDFEEFDSESYQGEGLVPYNRIKELVNKCNAAIDFFDEVDAKCQYMKEITSVFTNISFELSSYRGETVYNKSSFSSHVQKQAWRTIFGEMNMGKYMTTNLMKDIDKFVDQQSDLPFTYKNVMKMVEIVVGTHDQRMDAVYIDVFNKLTEYHKDNRYGKEGWKTNSNYLVNRKFILPYVFKVDYNGELDVCYNGRAEVIEDLIKVLCHITGKNYDDIPKTLERFVNTNYIEDFEHYNTPEKREGHSRYYDRWRKEQYEEKLLAITREEFVDRQVMYNFKHNKDKIKPDFGKWFDYEFFRIKGYKKGSAHVEFKDEEVWAMFCREIARIRGFELPPEMTEEAHAKRKTKKRKKGFVNKMHQEAQTSMF